MAFGSEIAKLLASLDLDTKPFEKGAGRVSGDLSKMEGGFSRISTRATILGTAVGQGIERLAEKGISVLFDSIRSGEDALHVLQDEQGQTAAIIETTGGAAGQTAQSIRDLANAMEDLSTVDDKNVQAGENVLLRYTAIGKDIFPQATKAATDLAVAMAKGDAANADVASSAAQIGKALQDPLKGLTSLRKAGVVFTAQEQDQIKALVKAGDTMGAQQAILKALEVRYGKAGEAAGKTGVAGVRRLNDAIEDSQIALAEGLAPALEDIRTEITRGLNDPGTQRGIRDLGVFLGDAAKSGLAFAKSVPWGQIGDGLKTAGHFAGELFKVFANLPPGVQATIIGLAGLNKLAGGGVIKIGVDLFKEGAKGLFGQFFSRGSPANPMFVTGTGLGAGGGLPVPAKGGVGALGKLFLVGEAIGLIAAVNEVRDNIATGLSQQSTDIHTGVTAQLNNQTTTTAQLTQSLAGVNQGIEKLSHDPIGNALLGDQLDELQKMRAELEAALASRAGAAADAGRLKVAVDDAVAPLTGNEKKAAYEAYQQRQRQLAAAAAAQRAIDSVRDESARAAIAAGGDAQRIQTAAGTTGPASIVAAIQRNRAIVNVSVSVTGTVVKVDKTYSQGDMGGGNTGGHRETGGLGGGA